MLVANIDEDFIGNCLREEEEINDFIHLTMSKSFDKKDLQSFVTLLLKCKLNSHFTYMLQEVFHKIFAQSEELIQPATVAIFQLLCDNYVQRGSNVLNTYFKENMYHLLCGLSHSIPEVKGSCASSLMVVLDLDDIQQYNCLLYTSPSPRDKRQSRMPSSA